MINRILKRFTSLMLVAVLLFSLAPTFTLTAFAETSGDLTGLSSSDIGASYIATDSGSNASWSASGNTITGKVISTSGTCGDTAYETTLTLTNKKSTTATLSFDYTIAQNGGTIQVAGNKVTANGSYSGELADGDSIKVYLKSGSTTDNTSISITNLALISNVTATTTFLPGENGSYTVDGVEITAETTKTQQSTVAYTLAATPASGYKFIGWYSVTEEKYLSSDTAATMSFDIDQTITAVFTEETNPVFDVSGAKFTDLNEANEYAVTNSLSKIVLVSDGTLNSGSYTVSRGVTLLIPFDSAYTCYTTTPANTGEVWTNPSVYKTLTMAEGASITVDGAISVSAKHYAYGQTGAGAPCGKYGYIYMNSGSSITVNSGGGLYVYGYVSGNGTVTAKSGATVYENMQICDFRGGNATLSMNNNAQKIFPLNQYFIQNIEAKLILESGADEYIYTSIFAAKTATSTAVHFIGNEGAMFSVEEGGYFSKQYLPDKDRLEINVSGNAKINNLTLTVMGMTVSSSNYVLPITNCMTLNVLSGTTQITQDVALLAGVQVNIASGATVQVNERASLYVYDHDEWTQANYASNAKFKTVLYSPTRTYTRTANDLIDARININGTLQSDGYVYTTAGGADITSSEGTGKFILTNGAGTEKVTYMYKDYTTTYDEIPITPAKLHNGSQYVGKEEEYTLTDSDTAGSSTYFWNSSDSKWKLEGETETITITFNANDDTSRTVTQTVDSGADATLNANTFTREHMSFKEWNTAPDGSGTAYADGATVNFTEDTTLYVIWEPETFTVTWVNDDGTELKKEEKPYGTKPEYNGVTPTKAADAQYTYTFSGWSPAIDENTVITADVTYKAVYTSTVNTYTVTWKNADGTVLETDEAVPYGTKPEYNGDVPTKTGDAQYIYTFSGWTPEISAVTGNVTYTAQYTSDIKGYTVTWVNDDGTVLETDQNVAYGTLPTYDSTTPTKAADAQYTYTFNGWDPEISAVTGDATYKAVYTTTVNTYTVTWKNYDGTELETDTDVAYGTTPIYDGATPTKARDDAAHTSYTFSGWTPAVSAVTGNVTYTATFNAVLDTYTVKWVNWDDSELETDQNVAYGTVPTYDSTTPTKAADAQYTYIFKGWTPAVSEVTGNVTYKAEYTTQTNTYTVTWQNSDGAVLETDENVEYGTMPSYDGATPTKARDEAAHRTFTFSGWTPEIATVTGNATYTATYTETIDTFQITWQDDEGKTLRQDMVAYGQVPCYGENPTKDQTMTVSTVTTYTFEKWEPTVTAVTGNATYKAVFTPQETARKYTVTWKNGDTVLKTEQVAYGATPKYTGEKPTKPEDTRATYTFSGWEPEVSSVTGDVTYNAVFTETIKQYTITWMNDDNSVLDTEQVAYGQTPAYNGTPVSSKVDTDKYTYTFKGWTPEISAVTGHATYTALYTQTINTYTVTWADVDGTTLETDENVSYGSVPTYDGETPAKEADAQYTYTFSGWSPAIDENTVVTADVTYTAEYTSTVNTYTVTWVDADGTVLETDNNVEYGTVPTYDGATPSKAGSDHITYAFDGWTPNISDVTGNVTYKATYETHGETHTVTFDANGGEGTMAAQTFEYGVDTQLSQNLFTYTDHAFTGWNTKADGTGATYADEGSIIDLTEDITLYAQWEVVNGWYTDQGGTTYLINKEKAYFSKWIDLDGSTYYFDENGYIVKGIYKTSSQNGTYEARFVFDPDTGAFLENQCGLYNVNADTYWTENGAIVEEAGLVRIVKENGEVNYYYFAVEKNVEENPDLEVSKAVKNLLPEGGKDCWIHKTNDLLLPEWGYYFDENGVILHDPDTSLNGIYREEESGILYYYVDGVKAPAGLIQIGEDYYYANSKGALIVNQTYYCTRMNDLLPEGPYAFDENGKMISSDPTKNGIVEENDSLYYYENGQLTYAGLIQIDGDYYYVRSNCEVVHGQTYYISWTHGLMEQGYYTFDDDGKMLEQKNGIVAEDGSLFYYQNSARTYAGLIQIDGEYYYVKSSCEVVHGCTYWISKTNGLLPEGNYVFAEDGKMQVPESDPKKDGIVEENGSLYYYANGVRTYAGLIQIDGDYYYVRSNCEVVHGRQYYISWTHDLLPAGNYTFDDTGKIIQ